MAAPGLIGGVDPALPRPCPEDSFHWAKYFALMATPAMQDLNVATPEFFKAEEGLLKSQPIAVFRTYLTLHLLQSQAMVVSARTTRRKQSAQGLDRFLYFIALVPEHLLRNIVGNIEVSSLFRTLKGNALIFDKSPRGSEVQRTR